MLLQRMHVGVSSGSLVSPGELVSTDFFMLEHALVSAIVTRQEDAVEVRSFAGARVLDASKPTPNGMVYWPLAYPILVRPHNRVPVELCNLSSDPAHVHAVVACAVGPVVDQFADVLAKLTP